MEGGKMEEQEDPVVQNANLWFSKFISTTIL